MSILTGPYHHIGEPGQHFPKILFLCFLVLLFLVPRVNADLDDGLIFHAKLDENSGIIAYDEIDGVQGLLVNSPLWVPSYYSYGLDFDGVDAYVDFPDLGDFPENGTVSFWTNGLARDYSNLFCTQVSTTTGLRVQLYSTGLALVGVNANTHIFYTGVGADDFPSGSWIMLTITWDGVQDEISVYVNGSVLVDGASQSAYPATIPDLNLGRGYQDNPVRYYDGVLDDFRIYNRSLTGPEVQELFNLESETALTGEESLAVSFILVLIFFAISLGIAVLFKRR